MTENGRVTRECVTGDNPPSYGQPRKRAWPPPETPIGEGRVHSLQPQARLSHTTMARTTRSTATTQPDKDKLSPASDDALSTSLSKNKKSKKRKRDSVNEHEDQPATKLPRQEEDISHSPKSEDLQSPPPIISETYLDSDLAQQILETLEMYVRNSNHSSPFTVYHHFLGSTHRASWTEFFPSPKINQNLLARSEHYSKIRQIIHSGR